METPRRALRNLHLSNVANQSTPLKIPPSPFMKSLGYGTGVNVFRLDRSPKCGQMRSPWAIKRVSQRARCAGQDEFNVRIQTEAKILRQLTHPNIVGFRGIQKADDGVDSLALECCNTCLGTILEERMEEEMGPLPAKSSLRMIFDITKALDYLHNEAKILHGDLKSFNILVKGDFEICKLCDFGVSIPLNKDGLVNFKENPALQYVGTSHWSAPEVIDQQDIIDNKADIFSFGLIVYETMSLLPPHMVEVQNDESKENTSLDDSDLEMADYMDAALGTRPPLPQNFALGLGIGEEYNLVVEVFFCCTNELPEDRPCAKTIWTSLENNETFKKIIS